MNWTREASIIGRNPYPGGLPARNRNRMVRGGGLAILTLSSRNMHIDNPGAIVKIPLANRHQYGK